MEATTIKISYEYPPIPDRRFDYRAGYRGHEEDGKDGFGETPQKALAELLENYYEE